MIRKHNQPRTKSIPAHVYISELLDVALSISGSAGNLRQHLEQQGFDSHVAQMMAAQWGVNMLGMMTK